MNFLSHHHNVSISWHCNDVTGNLHVTIWYAASRVTQKIFAVLVVWGYIMSSNWYVIFYIYNIKKLPSSNVSSPFSPRQQLTCTRNKNAMACWFCHVLREHWAVENSVIWFRTETLKFCPSGLVSRLDDYKSAFQGWGVGGLNPLHEVVNPQSYLLKCPGWWLKPPPLDPPCFLC